MDKLIFVDLETTGCSAQFDRIVEIGMLRVENNNVVATYNKLINPECYMSPFITQITGIHSEDFENAPTFYSVKDEVMELLKDCVFVAHNARFDYGFMQQEFKRQEMTFTAKQLCTAKLSRRLFPQYPHHNLDSIIQRFGFKCENRHRAYDDAKVMFDFYTVLQKQIDQKDLEEAVNVIMKKPSRPQQIEQSIIDTLPEGPGVYMFYGEQQMPLYIGKSINIRNRVLSHFSADTTSHKEMKISNQIVHIKTIQTSGELGALLLESTLIKQQQPLYNRKLRYLEKMVVLKKYTNEEGYECIKVETIDHVDTSEMENIMGIFKTQKSAKDFLREIAHYHYLCDNLLNLEKGKGACFSSKLGICKGACEKKELYLKYNMRFTEAFTKTRLKKWPFQQPIAVQEQNTSYVIDQWCYVGKMVDGEFEREADTEISFDYDTYKILSKYINDPLSKKNIHVLPPHNLEIPTHFA